MELDSISHTSRVHWEADQVEPFAPGQVLLQLDVDSGGRRFHLAVSEARRAASVLHSSSVRGPATAIYTRRHVPGSRAPGTCAGRWRGPRDRHGHAVARQIGRRVRTRPLLAVASGGASKMLPNCDPFVFQNARIQLVAAQ
jgi:hypothetical protein